MENKLEQLLNSLIERWRVPFGDEKIHSFEIIYVTWKIRNIVAKRWRWQVNMHYSIRDVVSKESWLWQFVCEKELIKSKWDSNYVYFNIHGTWKAYEHWNYEYRLIESALKDESELEQFLLQNINVEWKHE